MTGFAQLFRRGGDEKKARRNSRESFDDFILHTRCFRTPAKMMRFINNQKIPTRTDRLRGARFFLRKKIKARENQLIFLEWIAVRLMQFDGSAAFFIENRKPKV